MSDSVENDAACVHPDFEAQVIVTRLEDSGLFATDIKVWCSACALPFEFPESIPIGLDLRGIARSLSGQELRVAIRPATSPDDWSDRSVTPTDMCHNGHPFEPGITVDDLPGESHPDWCNVCGETRIFPPELDRADGAA